MSFQSMERYRITSLCISEGETGAGAPLDIVMAEEVAGKRAGQSSIWLAPPDRCPLCSRFDGEHDDIQNDVFAGKRVIEIDHGRMIR